MDIPSDTLEEWLLTVIMYSKREKESSAMYQMNLRYSLN